MTSLSSYSMAKSLQITQWWKRRLVRGWARSLARRASFGVSLSPFSLRHQSGKWSGPLAAAACCRRSHAVTRWSSISSIQILDQSPPSVWSSSASPWMTWTLASRTPRPPTPATGPRCPQDWVLDSGAVPWPGTLPGRWSWAPRSRTGARGARRPRTRSR